MIIRLMMPMGFQWASLRNSKALPVIRRLQKCYISAGVLLNIEIGTVIKVGYIVPLYK